MHIDHRALIRQYLLMFFAILLAVCSLVGFFFQSSYRQTERSVETELNNTAATIEARLTATLLRIDSDLDEIAVQIPHAAMLEKNIPQFADSVIQSMNYRKRLFPELNSYRIYDREGRDLYYTGPRGARHSIAERSYFKCAQEQLTKRLCFSEAILGKVSKKPVIAVARAITDEQGKFLGLVLGAIDLEHYVQLFSSLNLGENSAVVLRRSGDGALLARWPELNEELNTPLKPGSYWRERMAEGVMNGSMKSIAQTDGIERIYVLKRLADYPFAIFVGAATSDYLSEWHRALSLTSALVALVMLSVAALLRRQMQSHISELDTARNVERVLDNVHDALIVYRVSDGVVLRTNRVMHDAFGINADAALRYGLVDFSATPDGPDLLREHQFAALAGERRVFEWRARRPADGSEFDAEVHLSRFDFADEPALLMSITDITGRKESEKTFIAAKEAAEAASRAKSVFLANMSHELRTPLNAILGFAQIMERDSKIPDEQRRNLATINRSGTHLLALINDVLEISRIESGRLVATAISFDLHDLLAALSESMSLRAQNKGLVLRLDIAPNLPVFIVSDVGKLRQILLNLLSNAVKFTREGEIVLSARVLRHEKSTYQLEFAVTDTGIGLKPNELQRLFAAFYQTDAGVRQGEGTGLGLAISRQYALLLGGQLTAESTPGRGSVFRLNLSVETSAAPPELHQVHGRVKHLQASEPAYRVLVAEDEGINQEILKMLLEDVGFEVRLADDGAQAVETFKSWQPHFIWMDMRMPVMDGFAATRTIRSLPGGESLPIVAFTASAFAEDRIEILAAGCNDVMTKPLVEERLFALMTQYLGAHFEYEALPDTPETTENGNGKVDFAALPASTLQALKTAALALDGDAIRKITSELATTQPALANAIAQLAEGYRYEELQEKLATASNPGNSSN